MASGDLQETTFNFDYANKLVNVYTTKRSVFLAFLKRNPNAIKIDEYQGGGYNIQYSLDQLRGLQFLLKPAPGGAEVVDEKLTDAERAKRAAAGERLSAARKAKSL
jgi:hypothetical protein